MAPSFPSLKQTTNESPLDGFPQMIFWVAGAAPHSPPSEWGAALLHVAHVEKEKGAHPETKFHRGEKHENP